MKYLVGMERNKKIPLLKEINGKKIEELQQYRKLNDIHHRIRAAGTVNKMKSRNIQSRFPGDIAIGVCYPAVNPENIYSEKEAGFKERLARIHEAAQLRDPKVREILHEIENSKEVLWLKSQMHTASQDYFERNGIAMRAFKIREEKMEPEEKQAFADYAAALDMMEYIVGIQPEIKGTAREMLSEQIEKKMLAGKEQQAPENQKQGTDFWIEQIGQYGKEVVYPWQMPNGKLKINFENADHILTNIQMAVPKYKDVSQNILSGSKLKDEAALPYMKEYFKGTANRLLDPIYDNFERKASGMDRMDLIVVGNKSVRELMDEKHGKEAVDSWTPAKRKSETALLVAAGVQSGARVAAMIPRADGTVNGSPVPISGSGFHVEEMKKVEEGFWTKLFYAIGDFLRITHHEADKRAERLALERDHDTYQASINHICRNLEEHGILDETLRMSPEGEKMMQEDGKQKMDEFQNAQNEAVQKVMESDNPEDEIDFYL